MTWNKILAAVDATAAGRAAAEYAWNLAAELGGTCDLIHMSVDVRTMPATLDPTTDLDALMKRVTASARNAVAEVLRDGLPENAVEALEVVIGKPAWALRRQVQRRGSDLVVLGGKHHSKLGRWLGGSLAHYAVRTLDVPVMIVTPASTDTNRVLAAVDLSEAGDITLRAARALADLHGGELKVVHAVEPLPGFYSALPPPSVFRERAEARLETWLADTPEADGVAWEVREGHASAVISEVARDWSADVVVAGSHGKGFLDRMFLGSTTQRLLYRLPASLLVVPVRVTSGSEVDEEAAAAAHV